MRKTFTLVLLFSLLFALIPFQLISAQSQQQSQSQGISVDPAILEIIVRPEEPLVDEIVVSNPTDIPIPIKGSVKSFIPNEEISSEDKSIFQAQSWFKLSEPDFILQPKQIKKIIVTVTAPKDVAPGGHYATIFFESLIPEELVSEDRLYLTGRVGVLVFMVAPGDINERASLAGLSVGERFYQSGPATFKVSIKNDGNVHLLPRGDVIIYNLFGKEVARVPLKPGLVLPKTTRKFELTWDKKNSFGIFKAVAKIQYGTETKELQSSSTLFLSFPSLLIVLLGLVAMALGVFLLRKRKQLKAAIRVLRGQDQLKDVKKKDKKSVD